MIVVEFVDRNSSYFIAFETEVVRYIDSIIIIHVFFVFPSFQYLKIENYCMFVR